MTQARRPLIAAVCLWAAATFAFSCTEKEDLPVGGTPADGLKAAYFSEKYYESCSHEGDATVFSFSDGSDISITDGSFRVFDLSFRDRPEVAADPSGQFWTVNLVKTDARVEPLLPDADASPVCVWYDDRCVNIFISNGHVLEIAGKEGFGISSFVFRSSDNALLDASIVCRVENGRVIGARPIDLKSYKLIPDFTFRGRSLSVGGEEQIPGVSRQDFSNPVEYVIERFDGTLESFTVSLVVDTDFPTVFIDTDGAAPILDKENYVPATIRIEDPLGLYGEVSVMETRGKIRGRGNTTWDMPKKPYRIKFDKAAPVFSREKFKNWVLLANYSDKTLLRNMVAMEISRIAGMEWTPALFPVELYLNGKYQGCYMFGDHKEVAKYRVDIAVAGPQDNTAETVTGGYYLEIDELMDEPVCFKTDMRIPIMFQEPSEPTAGQLNYVTNYFREFENALSSRDFCDPSMGYRRYVDVESFIANYIVQELTKNIDGNLRKSTFLTKERGGKLTVYHVWDFDIALGNCNYFANEGLDNSYKDFFIKDHGRKGPGTGWYCRMFEDPAFVAEVKARWVEIYPQLCTVPAFITDAAALIRPAADRNFRIWPILGTHVWPNVVVKGTYDGEVNYLKSFYTERLHWLNDAILAL